MWEIFADLGQDVIWQHYDKCPNEPIDGGFHGDEDTMADCPICGGKTFVESGNPVTSTAVLADFKPEDFADEMGGGKYVKGDALFTVPSRVPSGGVFIDGPMMGIQEYDKITVPGQIVPKRTQTARGDDRLPGLNNPALATLLRVISDVNDAIRVYTIGTEVVLDTATGELVWNVDVDSTDRIEVEYEEPSIFVVVGDLLGPRTSGFFSGYFEGCRTVVVRPAEIWERSYGG